MKIKIELTHMLYPDKYDRHNFHNEKVNKWLIDNHIGASFSYE